MPKSLPDHLSLDTSTVPKKLFRTLVAGVLVVGCADIDAAHTGNTDARVQDIPVDVAEDSAGNQGPCWFDIESTNTKEPFWIGRDEIATVLSLIPRDISCYDRLLENAVPKEDASRPTYRRAAQVCMNINRTQVCRDADFVFIPGGSTDAGSFKTVLNVGPVNFSTFPGLPADYNAVNVPVTVIIPHEPRNFYTSALFNFDWTRPQVSAPRTTVTANNLDLAFTTSEHGTWGIAIAGEDIATTRSCRAGLSDNCDDGQYCILQERGTICAVRPWGGRVNSSGGQAVTIPFASTVGREYAATLFFRDQAGNYTHTPFTFRR